jgi:uncharacterized membrane protein
MEKKKCRWTTPLLYVYRRYLIQAMGGMALGLFASLVVGLILSQMAKIPGMSFLGYGSNLLAATSPVIGAAVGVAVAHALKAPVMVMVTCAVTGAMGYELGGPVGAYLASVISCEIGRLVSGKTKVDIVLTPMVVIVVGGLVSRFVGPGVSNFMIWLGGVVNASTNLAPVPMGFAVATVVGMSLSSPISSAALCIMLKLDGLAAGAAVAGCSAQMIGFAVVSFSDNSWGGLISQGLGTSKFQLPNIMRNPAIWIAPTLAGSLLGMVSAAVLGMTNTSTGAGMGTSGLVGQFGAWQAMVTEGGMFWGTALLEIVIIHFIAPALLSYGFYRIIKKLGWIKPGDMLLNRQD